MIDYVKIYLKGINIHRLLYYTGLNFNCVVSKTTGEISEDTLIAKYHFCEIIIKNAKSEIPHILFKGSIHKFWNDLNSIKAPNFESTKPDKGFNGNLFNLNNIIEVRNHLEKLFDCKASQMIFQNIELGVNSVILFDPSFFLKGLLYHQNKKFEFRDNDKFAKVIHNRFILKIYNKSSQYGMSDNILRVELKIIKMEELKSFGIRTFANINSTTLEKVKDLLLKRFSEIVQYDYSINKNQLSKRNLELLNSYSNPRYWIEDLKPNHRDRHKKNLNSLILNFSSNLHQQISEEIIEKCVMINRSSIGLNITQYSLQKSPNNSLIR